MKKLIRGLLLITTIMLMGMTVQAKETTRYTTQTVTLRSSRNGEALLKVKRNTKVKLIKSGNVWARVTYKGDLYKVRKKHLCPDKAVKKHTGRQFRRAGVYHWNNKKWTWYSQRILPGHGLKIPGRHVDSQGFVCDKWDYIVLGSSTKNRGKIVATPFGKFGKVYDAGYVGTYWFDCYTNF